MSSRTTTRFFAAAILLAFCPTTKGLVRTPLRCSAGKLSAAGAKAALLKTSLVSGRGAWARPAEKSRLADLVVALEDAAADEVLSSPGAATMDGTWELVASDLEPFRASVFFLALASQVESGIRRGASTPALSVHRLATSISEVERTAWVISDGTLKSLVQLKVGSVPSIPIALDGVVVSTGSIRKADNGVPTQSERKQNLEVTLMDTSVLRNTVMYGLPQESGLTPFENDSLLKFISDQVAPSGDVFRNVLNQDPTAKLCLTAIDDDMIIARVPQLDPESYFVFLRSDDETDPWRDVLEEMEERRDTQSRSILGSAAALGMLNPFFSRRARGDL